MIIPGFMFCCRRQLEHQRPTLALDIGLGIGNAVNLKSSGVDQRNNSAFITQLRIIAA